MNRQYNIKNTSQNMKGIIALVLIVLTFCSCGSQQETNNDDLNEDTSSTYEQGAYSVPTYESTIYETEEKEIISESEAVQLAMDSYLADERIREICGYRGLKSIYPYKITAYKVEDSYDDWRVTLKGKVSGYTDDYQTKFATETFDVLLFVDKETGFVD